MVEVCSISGILRYMYGCARYVLYYPWFIWPITYLKDEVKHKDHAHISTPVIYEYDGHSAFLHHMKYFSRWKGSLYQALWKAVVLWSLCYYAVKVACWRFLGDDKLL
jgi:hypothetical protein